MRAMSLQELNHPAQGQSGARTRTGQELKADKLETVVQRVNETMVFMAID